MSGTVVFLTQPMAFVGKNYHLECLNYTHTPHVSVLYESFVKYIIICFLVSFFSNSLTVTYLFFCIVSPPQLISLCSPVSLFTHSASFYSYSLDLVHVCYVSMNVTSILCPETSLSWYSLFYDK